MHSTLRQFSFSSVFFLSSVFFFQALQIHLSSPFLNLSPHFCLTKTLVSMSLLPERGQRNTNHSSLVFPLTVIPSPEVSLSFSSQNLACTITGFHLSWFLIFYPSEQTLQVSLSQKMGQQVGRFDSGAQLCHFLAVTRWIRTSLDSSESAHRKPWFSVLASPEDLPRVSHWCLCAHRWGEPTTSVQVSWG